MQMKNTLDAQASISEGRAMQYELMMERLAALQAKYKGVRGELLAKVREELAQLKPTRTAPVAAAPRATVHELERLLPSCRACGRPMKPNGAPGLLVCANGHSRLVA